MLVHKKFLLSRCRRAARQLDARIGKITRPDLVFKTIPTDEGLNELWKLKIKRKKYPKDHNIVLCSEHFAKDCFERDFASEFKHKSTKELYRIKDDAVPSIFSHTSSPSPRVSSENRSAKAAKRKITRGLCDGPSLPSYNLQLSKVTVFCR